jgi:tRNA nucleotidyltransferase/poly(A) polymerase
MLLGMETTDWDFATSATPEQLLHIFPDSFYHNTYGTVTVKWGAGGEEMLFEITPYRTEHSYTDNRRPDTVVWADDVKEDLARRDFTMNAMAYDGESLIDPFGGKQDLEAKLIRTVGDPDARFGEDALRLMRAIRFAAQLGFLIEPKTRESITRNSALITRISWERIRDEFLRTICAPHASEGVLFLKNSNILRFILPELDACFGIPQKSPGRHHIYDVGTHLVMSLKHSQSQDPITRFATLIHDVGKVRTFHKDPESGMITFYNHEVVGTHQAVQIADRFRLSKDRHCATFWRTSLIMEVGSYCCSLVERPFPSSNTRLCCSDDVRCFLGFGIGVMNSARRRFSLIFWVGCPYASSSQCRPGAS